MCHEETIQRCEGLLKYSFELRAAPDFRVSSLLKFTCPPAPFQSPGTGLGSNVTCTSQQHEHSSLVHAAFLTMPVEWFPAESPKWAEEGAYLDVVQLCQPKQDVSGHPKLVRSICAHTRSYLCIKYYRQCSKTDV